MTVSSVWLYSSRNIYTLLVGIEKPSLKYSLSVSYKLKPPLTIWLIIPALMYLLQRNETFLLTKHCIWMFIATLWIFSQSESYQILQLVNGLKEKKSLYYIHTMDFYLLIHTTSCIPFKYIMLSERSQTHKLSVLCDFMCNFIYVKEKMLETGGILVVSRDWMSEDWLTAKGHRRIVSDAILCFAIVV